MENQVEEHVKKERAKELQKVSNQLYSSFLNKNIGQITDVMIEKHFDKQGNLKGITPNYLNVIIKENNADFLNSLKKVKITGVENEKLVGIFYYE